MTSKELFYKWVCDKTENVERRFSFEQTNDGAETYFEEIENQPVLVEYDIKSKCDMEKYMEKYFDDDLVEIETVCVRAFLEGISKIEERVEKKEIRTDTGIREYIYNF